MSGDKPWIIELGSNTQVRLLDQFPLKWPEWVEWHDNGPPEIISNCGTIEITFGNILVEEITKDKPE